MNKQTFAPARWLRACAFLLLALGSLAAAQAQNRIESVTGSMQAGSEVLRVDFSEPLAAEPSGFAIQSPPRIALDFPGMASGLGREPIDVSQGNLRSVNVVQAGERARLVINLRQATAYRSEVRGKSLLVTLQPAAGPALAASASATFAENRNRDVLPLRDVDFRLGGEGTGRVIVSLPNDQVGVDIRQQGKGLLVEFTKSSLPEGLNRRLDVSDFGTPVQAVSLQQAGDRVRMVIDPRGEWEHSAYQSNSQFVVEVRPRKVDPTKLTQGVGYNGEKLSLNFQNIEIRSLLQVIADFTNFNIVTSDSVSGTLTLRLKDVPWDQALDIILQSKGLGMRKNGNVLVIAPKDELAAKDKLDLESRNAIQSLEPVRTQSFQINYAKAADLATQITAGGSGPASARILSQRGSVIAEPRTNLLFVTDIPSRLEAVQNLITKLDVAVRQVLIEARIVEASDSFGKSLGVRLGGQPFNQTTNSAFGGTYSAATAGTNAGEFLSLPAVGQNGFSAATFAVSLFNSAKTRFLNLEISASEADGKSKIVSSPRVVTADQVKALIEQGTELPYQQATSSGATSISFRKANLKLEVTPQITPEGNIILNVDVNKDSVGRETANGFAIDTKHIQTQVLVENGGTVVIGGIFEQNDRDAETKVPLLGDLPGVGNLFKQKTRSATKSELLVFITPKMLTNGSALR